MCINSTKAPYYFDGEGAKEELDPAGLFSFQSDYSFSALLGEFSDSESTGETENCTQRHFAILNFDNKVFLENSFLTLIKSPEK